MCLHFGLLACLWLLQPGPVHFLSQLLPSLLECVLITLPSTGNAIIQTWYLKQLVVCRTLLVLLKMCINAGGFSFVFKFKGRGRVGFANQKEGWALDLKVTRPELLIF
jgi:hypothetical protein